MSLEMASSSRVFDDDDFQILSFLRLVRNTIVEVFPGEMGQCLRAKGVGSMRSRTWTMSFNNLSSALDL